MYQQLHYCTFYLLLSGNGLLYFFVESRTQVGAPKSPNGRVEPHSALAAVMLLATGRGRLPAVAFDLTRMDSENLDAWPSK